MSDIQSAFKESMGRLATGVTTVTTEVDGRPWGTTVSACCSVSVDPPLLLVSLLTTSASTKEIRERQRFGVSVLRHDQADVAKAGAQPGVPKFFEDYTELDGDGRTHRVTGSLAHISCEVSDVVVAGDHTIFIGAVEHVTLDDAGEPLLHYSRQFGAFAALQPAA